METKRPHLPSKKVVSHQMDREKRARDKEDATYGDDVAVVGGGVAITEPNAVTALIRSLGTPHHQ